MDKATLTLHAHVKLPYKLVSKSKPGRDEGEETCDVKARVEPDPRRPCVLAAIAIRQPRPEARVKPRTTPEDPFGLGRHLEEQRHPREPQSPRSERG